MSRARNRADANAPDDSITSADLAPDIVLTGGSVGIPSVSTANLPGTGGGTYAAQTATNGMLVYNLTLGVLQQRADGVWAGIANVVPIITSFEYSDGSSATAEKTIVGLVSVSCTTQTSTTVLVPGASLGIQVGQRVAGTGIPAGTTVVSVILDTSFVISAAATASATVTLTFGGVVTITGTNFDSILGGSVANVAVTFDGTSATSISVNSIKTIITCTPPAHAAGTITLLVANGDGQSASTDFIYDEEAIFTTAAGTLGNFVDATYTANADAPRIEATDGEGSPSALTTGFQRVTSASDDTVITTTIQGLTVLTSGYLTGTLSATEGTTYPFYATAKDSQNQRTAPRLFNIISAHPASALAPDGSTVIASTTYDIGDTTYIVFTFLTVGTSTFTVNTAMNIDYLVVGGGGGGGGLSSNTPGAGGGGAGAFRTAASFAVTVQNYTITVGLGGLAGGVTGNLNSSDGDNSSIVPVISGSSIISLGGGKGAMYNPSNVGGTGGSGGGASLSQAAGVSGTYGNAGGATSSQAGGGGGGAGGTGSPAATAYGETGGAGTANSYRTNSAVTYAGGGGGGGGYPSSSAGGGGASGGGGVGGAANSASGTGNDGTAGTPNTGGGGGGGGGGVSSVSSDGGRGGSGIVVIRYAV